MIGVVVAANNRCSENLRCRPQVGGHWTPTPTCFPTSLAFSDWDRRAQGALREAKRTDDYLPLRHMFMAW